MKMEMSPEKSLKIITQMINESKETYKHHSFYFLLWGWLMISAALAEYYLLNIDYQFHFLPWIVFSVLGGIVSVLKGAKDKKRISTFADKVISYTWIGFVITMIITLIAVVPANPNPFV